MRRDPYGIHILRRDTARALEPRKGMVVGLPKVVIDASHAAHALAAYDALAASEQRLAEALEQAHDALTDPRGPFHEQIRVALGIVGNAIAKRKALAARKALEGK